MVGLVLVAQEAGGLPIGDADDGLFPVFRFPTLFHFPWDIQMGPLKRAPRAVHDPARARHQHGPSSLRLEPPRHQMNTHPILAPFQPMSPSQTTATTTV